MYKCKIVCTSDINGVQVIRENCLGLYATKDLVINPSQVYMASFEASYTMDEEVVGVPFLDKTCVESIRLYHTNKGFRWEGSKTAQVPFYNKTKQAVTIKQGTLMCKCKLMTIQFFNLTSRGNGSDKGLRSSMINIELSNEYNTNKPL